MARADAFDQHFAGKSPNGSRPQQPRPSHGTATTSRPPRTKEDDYVHGNASNASIQSHSHRGAPYQVLERIGEGSFGRVYRGRRMGSGQIVALKFIPKKDRSSADLAALRSEIEILRRLDHPNIIRMLDAYETPREFCLVMEFAPGELFRILQDDGKLPLEAVRSIAAQMCRALSYLHANRIIHRDMKP